MLRQLAAWALQQLIEAQASEAIGAGRYERSDERVTERNGHRSRVLSTKAGDLNLKIPKLREGSFFPAALEPRRRIDQALYAVVMEACVLGVSKTHREPSVFSFMVVLAGTHQEARRWLTSRWTPETPPLRGTHTDPYLDAP